MSVSIVDYRAEFLDPLIHLVNAHVNKKEKRLAASAALGNLAAQQSPVSG